MAVPKGSSLLRGPDPLWVPLSRQARLTLVASGANPDHLFESRKMIVSSYGSDQPAGASRWRRSCAAEKCAVRPSRTNSCASGVSRMTIAAWDAGATFALGSCWFCSRFSPWRQRGPGRAGRKLFRRSPRPYDRRAKRGTRASRSRCPKRSRCTRKGIGSTRKKRSTGRSPPRSRTHVRRT